MTFLKRILLSRPAFVTALLVIPGVYIPGLSLWSIGFLGTSAMVSWWVRRPQYRRLATLLAFAALIISLGGLQSFFSSKQSWPFNPSGCLDGTGTVVAEAPVTRTGMVPFKFRIEAIERGDWAGTADGLVTVIGYRGEPPPTGSRWRWSGVLSGDGHLFWRSGHPVGWTAPWWEVRSRLRDSFETGLRPLGEGPAALGLALLIGVSDNLTPPEKEAFRNAGCSHVLALSGMHLSLLALLLTSLLQRRIPSLWIFLVVQSFLAAFCFLAGPIPSLWRAWGMALLAGWWALNRCPVPPTELLAQSFLMVVALWPDLAMTLSFQLSCLALGGLFFWAQRWDRGLRPILGRWGAAQLGSSAAALAATVPLTLILFGEVRWIGLVAAPPLVLLTTVLMAGVALVLIALAVIPGFNAGFLAPVFDTLYHATFFFTDWAARAPAIPTVPAFGILALGGLGALSFFLYNNGSRRAPLPVSLNYDSPASLQAFLDDRGYNALKRWGQNFLINAGARRQILAALDLKPGEPVWEVGPGLGALTHHLVADGHPLTVFEIDPGYAAFLKAEFGDSPAGFEVVQGDVVKTWSSQPLAGTKTVGNLPYNAASAIVADFVEGGFFPEIFVVTVQLEMAQRMTATPGNKNYSSFSVLCQSAFKLDDIVTLKPGSFYPAPEVTSRVVRLRPHKLYPGMDHKRFSMFVRECFSSRRKTLRNNLPGAASALKVADEILVKAFADVGIDLGLRAEVLTVDQFVSVFRKVEA